MFYLSDRGGIANEDYVFAGTNKQGYAYGVIVDGATGLYPSNLFASSHASDAQWLSHTAGRSISSALAAGERPSDAIKTACMLCQEQFENAVGRAGKVENDLIPSATVSVVSMRDGWLDLAWLGDSPIALLLNDADAVERDIQNASNHALRCIRSYTPKVITFSSSELERLDERAKMIMVERSKGKKLTGNEKRKAISDILRAHRRLSNTPGGYFNFDPTGAGLSHLNTLSIRLERIRAVGGFSDGYFASFTLYGLEGLEDFLRKASHHHALSLLDRMRVVEASDPDFDTYPRFKQSDDASVFFL